MGDIYLRESRASTLARCDDLDKEIRNSLVSHKLHGRTCTRVSVYFMKKLLGLGLLSIRHQIEIQYVEKAISLENNPDIEEIKARYERLVNAKWRNSLTDAGNILLEIEINLPKKINQEDTNR